MAKRIAMVHTVPSLAETFGDLAAELTPHVTVHHVVHEQLLQRTVEQGHLSDRTSAELDAIVEEVGADADLVLVTCSTLGPAVDAIARHGRTPVIRVDEAMGRQALGRGRVVGVLATLRSTLEPTVALLERLAATEQRDIEVIAHLCEGAFEAVRSGDGDRHDELVRAGLEHLLASGVDVVVLAQASMARVVDSLERAPQVPVLSSPRLAMEHAAARLAEL